MTGEMTYISPEGIDQDGDCWEYHAELTKRLGAKLCRFDKYQGPYLCIGNDIRVGNPPYDVPMTLPGTIRLWLCPADDGFSIIIYNESTSKSSPPLIPDHDVIEHYARQLLT